MNVGLLYTPVSIFQMTRGALVLFVGTFSVIFLKRKLWLYQYVFYPHSQRTPLSIYRCLFQIHQMGLAAHCHSWRWSCWLEWLARQGRGQDRGRSPRVQHHERAPGSRGRQGARRCVGFSLQFLRSVSISRSSRFYFAW